MSTTTVPSPAAVADDADRSNAPPPNPLRRGLIGLRRLGPPSPSDSLRLSPRNHFFRSTSQHQNPATPRTPLNAADESAPSQKQISTQLDQSSATSGRKPEASTQAVVFHPNPITSLPQRTASESSVMARHRHPAALRGPALESRISNDAQRSTRTHDSASEAPGNSVADQTNGTVPEATEERSGLPTICFYPHQDSRQARPSLTFAPIIRTLPNESSVIRVGRYSEREGVPISVPTGPSDAPVGFKSKVVSRKHCEFSFANGSWQIKDVNSSSGTILNHIRLSQPNTESRLYPVKDGDLVQLGIDFRGGEEMIFRCVKIRIECNRGWQKRPNHFNVSRHAQLRKLGESGSEVDENKGECSICLGDVAPCQSLFIAACAHVWHYRCIRRMLMGSSYPHFTCPNCRAITDLNAELEVDHGEQSGPTADGPVEWSDATASVRATRIAHQPLQREASAHTGPAVADDDESSDIDLTDVHFGDSLSQTEPDPQTMDQSFVPRRGPSNAADASPTTPVVGMEIPRSLNASRLSPDTADGAAGPLRAASPTSADILAAEGPLTPRNNAGPFVYGGSGRRSGDGRLNAAGAARDGPV